jgi:hypothetical protein
MLMTLPKSRFTFFLVSVVICNVANGSEITVGALNFSLERHELIPGSFLEGALVLQANRPADKAGSGRYLHRNVEVVLWLAFQRQGAPEGLDFYQSKAVLAGLLERSERTLYFYLPPEIVDADRLREPFAWLVDIKISGRPLPMARDRVSSSLADPARVDNFRRMAERAVERTAGVLMNFPESPFFASEYPSKLSASPSYARPPNPRP